MKPHKKSYVFKSIAVLVISAFFQTSVIPASLSYAQASLILPFTLPKAGVMLHLSPDFTPAVLKGIVIHPENAFKFDFIVYKGDKTFTGAQKKEEYTKLIKYFLASLAVPEEDQWVNLSPYEKDRIIKNDFGKTEMGRDLLAQDYILKQITASLIYPQDKLGKRFWNEIYERAYQKFGTTNIPVNTFNKVWIVPDNADIYEKGNVAYLYKSHLKVMLEEDYLSLQKHSGITSSPIVDLNKAHTIGSQVVREVVLPELEKEVNEGQNFAPLRQVFSGMVLAAWYKRALKESLLGKIYANKAKVKGVDQNPQNNGLIYKQYLKAFKKGVFNFIQEDVDKYTNETIPRKYFSGGFDPQVSHAMVVNPTNAAILGRETLKAEAPNTEIVEAVVAPTVTTTSSKASAAMTVEVLQRIEMYKIGLKKMFKKGKVHFPEGLNNLENEKNPVEVLRKEASSLRDSSDLTWGGEFDPAGYMSKSELAIAQRGSEIKKDLAFQLFNAAKSIQDAIEAARVKKVTYVVLVGEDTKDDARNIIVENDGKLSVWLDDEVAVPVEKSLLLPSQRGFYNVSKKEGVRALAEIELIGMLRKKIEVEFGEHQIQSGYTNAELILPLISLVVERTGEDLGNHHHVTEGKYTARLTFKEPAGNKVEVTRTYTDWGYGTPASPAMIVNYVKDKLEQAGMLVHGSVVEHPGVGVFVVNVVLPGDESSDMKKTALVELSKALGWAQAGTYITGAVKDGTGYKVTFVVDAAMNSAMTVMLGYHKAYDQLVGLLKNQNVLLEELKGVRDDALSLQLFVDRLLQNQTILRDNRLYSRVQSISEGLSRFIQAVRPSNQFGSMVTNAQMASNANHADFAMTKGGIDLNAAMLSFHIKRDGNGVPLPVSQQDLNNINIDGLTPKILDIRSTVNSPVLSVLQVSGT